MASDDRKDEVRALISPAAQGHGLCPLGSTAEKSLVLEVQRMNCQSRIKMLLTSIFHCVNKITFYPHLEFQESKFSLNFKGIPLVFTGRVG
jgi:hypothetical protein